MIITGENLSPVISDLKVTFNGNEAVVTAATTSQLTVTVPASAESGPVVVTAKGKTASNKPIFTVTEPLPEVNSISPTSGLINTSVVISGKNFSTLPGDITVTFNNLEGMVTSATVTQITVTVPALAETGPVVVSITGNTAVNQPVFTVTTVPILTTSDVIIQTTTSASGGGNITKDGGSAVVFRGVCWSGTNPLPTINDNKTSDGAGTGTFISTMPGLMQGMKYYARAYATNSFGTGYGDVVIFTALAIGQAYKGGIVAYIYERADPGFIDGECHGLIATKNDFSALPWRADDDLITGSVATPLGSGADNTERIVNVYGFKPLGPRYAASYCLYLGEGDYEDWFLPSKDELNKLYLNRLAIGQFVASYYWSSSEVSNTAWIQNFTTGVQSTYAKAGVFQLRPIRYF